MALAGVSGHLPLTEVSKVEAATQLGRYKFMADELEVLTAINNLRKNLGVTFELMLDARLNCSSTWSCKVYGYNLRN